MSLYTYMTLFIANFLYDRINNICNIYIYIFVVIWLWIKLGKVVIFLIHFRFNVLICKVDMSIIV